MATKKPKAPAPRSASQELSSLLPMLGQLATMQANAELEASKKKTEYQMGRLPTDYPMLQGLVRTETGKDRTSAIDFLRNEGGDAMDALYASSPELGARLNDINALADATWRTPEITELLDSQALDDLKLGGSLSPEEERGVQQSSRAAFSARGMALGKPSAIAEVLNRTSASQARKQQRQGFAASREAGNRQFTQSATQINDAVNPAMKILGMPTGAAAGMGNVMGFIQGVRTPDPGAMMGAGLSYGNDVYGSNFNADWTNYQSKLNQYYASKYGGMGMGGGGINGGMMALGGLAGAGMGALSGAAMGSVVPGIGTGIGALAGGLMGGLGGMSGGLS